MKTKQRRFRSNNKLLLSNGCVCVCARTLVQTKTHFEIIFVAFH